MRESRGSGGLPALVWVLLGALAGAFVVGLGTFVYVHFWAPQVPQGHHSTPPAHGAHGAHAPVVAVPTELPPFPEHPQETTPGALPEPLPVVESPTAVLPVVSATASAEPQALYPQGAGKIALVIDDMGMDEMNSAQMLAITPKAVTLAFLAEYDAAPTLAAQAKAQGHAVLLHLPMEPLGHNAPPLGPLGLKVGMDSPTLVDLVAKNLARLPQAEGVNNHMGSHFTQWEAGMQVVLAELANRGLYFLDSRTAAPTATEAAAQGLSLGLAKRDVFLDHEPTEAAVRKQVQLAVRQAQARHAKGHGLPVVVIAHPLPVTLAVLETDLPLIQAAGIELVPLKAAVR